MITTTIITDICVPKQRAPLIRHQSSNYFFGLSCLSSCLNWLKVKWRSATTFRSEAGLCFSFLTVDCWHAVTCCSSPAPGAVCRLNKRWSGWRGGSNGVPAQPQPQPLGCFLVPLLVKQSKGRGLLMKPTEPRTGASWRQEKKKKKRHWKGESWPRWLRDTVGEPRVQPDSHLPLLPLTWSEFGDDAVISKKRNPVEDHRCIKNVKLHHP